MKKLLLLFILAFFINFSTIPAQAATPAKSEVMTTLSTFYNESVSGSYTTSANASFVVPVAVASQGELTLTVNHSKIPEDYLLKIYNDDSYISHIKSTFLSTSKSKDKVTLTMGGSSTIYLYLAPATSNSKTKAASADAVSYDFIISASLTPASKQTINSSKTLNNQTWTKKRLITSNNKHYYKIVVKGNKAVQISSNNTYLNVMLLDKKKKYQLSTSISLKTANNFHTAFALTKGTYYIKVMSDYQSSYQLYTKVIKVPTKYGKNFDKAKSLTLGSQVIGMLDCNKKAGKGEYYKFKLSKASRISIAFYVECTSDAFMLEIYDSGFNEMPTSNFKCTNSSLLYINSINSIPAGTYYLKVSKTKIATSGCYGLNVKKS
ncbi:MAG: hypothetical protein K5656_09575 [Lachnospiraceae bacterium]|nr:hypothetical protein [Lachnospiraceae bacterium]